MNLYLIGFRGCGKSTIAPLVAAELAWKSVDTDEQVELLTGQSIAEIFAEGGEAKFREWETSVILGYSQKSDLVVSLGGGAPTIADNREAIRTSGKTVLLTAPADVLWKRICADPKSKDTRPNLTDLDGFAEVKTLFANRAGVYSECADYTIDTDKLSAQQAAEQIANWFDPVDK